MINLLHHHLLQLDLHGVELPVQQLEVQNWLRIRKPRLEGAGVDQQQKIEQSLQNLTNWLHLKTQITLQLGRLSLEDLETKEEQRRQHGIYLQTTPETNR